MASLKKAAHCIGLSGDISIIRDFYGYQTGTSLLKLSLLTQIRLLQGKHIHLNLIRTASFDTSQQKEIDFGLQFMRNIYATVTLGVGRIQRFFIPPGHEVIDGDSGFHDLINDFSVPNVGIDVFLVASISKGDGAAGLSPINGSCDKDAKDDSGCAIGVTQLADGVGIGIGGGLAHEVGHYLRLEHVDDINNVMFPVVPNGSRLTGGQGGEMKLHCSMRAGCRT